jgi:hypothetical protein
LYKKLKWDPYTGDSENFEEKMGKKGGLLEEFNKMVSVMHEKCKIWNDDYKTKEGLKQITEDNRTRVNQLLNNVYPGKEFTLYEDKSFPPASPPEECAMLTFKISGNQLECFDRSTKRRYNLESRETDGLAKEPYWNLSQEHGDPNVKRKLTISLATNNTSRYDLATDHIPDGWFVILPRGGSDKKRLYMCQDLDGLFYENKVEFMNNKSSYTVTKQPRFVAFPTWKVSPVDPLYMISLLNNGTIEKAKVFVENKGIKPGKTKETELALKIVFYSDNDVCDMWKEFTGTSRENCGWWWWWW